MGLRVYCAPRWEENGAQQGRREGDQSGRAAAESEWTPSYVHQARGQKQSISNLPRKKNLEMFSSHFQGGLFTLKTVRKWRWWHQNNKLAFLPSFKKKHDCFVSDLLMCKAERGVFGVSASSEQLCQVT